MTDRLDLRAQDASSLLYPDLDVIAWPVSAPFRSILKGSRRGAFRLVDLTDYAVQYRYQAPLDLQPLDRAATRDRVPTLPDEDEALL